jgi:hypothetical protein
MQNIDDKTVAESERIEASLRQTIEEAHLAIKAFGVGPQFKAIVRRAREIHDALRKSLTADLSPAKQRASAASVLGQAVDQLEILDFLADAVRCQSSDR